MLTPENCRNGIHPDPICLPEYGSDQAYVDFPLCFSTVTFTLNGTKELCEEADKVRESQGFAPLRDDEWYVFRLGINGFSKSKVDTCIDVTVENRNGYDIFSLDISDEEVQKAVREILDEELKIFFGKNIEEFLAEAEKKMQED